MTTTKNRLEDRINTATSRLNEETKSCSLNATLTNDISFNSIDELLLGDTSFRSKSLYKEDVELLLNELSIDIHEHKYLGPSAINEEIWNMAVKDSITAKPILKFINSKKGLIPFSFLTIVEVMAELSHYIKQRYKDEFITRDHFKDLSLYSLVIDNFDSSNYVKDILLKFHKGFVDPFCEERNQLLWNRKVITPISFNHPAYEKYVKYLLREKIAKNTILSYNGIFKRFFQWLTTVCKDFEEHNLNTLPIYLIKQDHLQDYKRYLLIQAKSGNRSQNKVSDDLYVIKDFFKYLYQNRVILDDVTKEIGTIKQKRYKYRDVPSRDEIKKFFNVIDIYADDPLSEGLAFGFLFNNGLRINELANLKWENVNFARNTLSLQRKGDKHCIIYIPTVLQARLKELYEKTEHRTFIFCDNPKKFKGSISKDYKVFAKLSGWNYPHGVHLFRHTFITYLSQQKCSPAVLKELADVENLEVLSYYIHRSDDELTDEINKLNFQF